MNLSHGQSHTAYFRLCASRCQTAEQSDLWLRYLAAFPDVPQETTTKILQRPLSPAVWQAVMLVSHQHLVAEMVQLKEEVSSLRSQLVRPARSLVLLLLQGAHRLSFSTACFLQAARGSHSLSGAKRRKETSDTTSPTASPQAKRVATGTQGSLGKTA